MNNLGIYRRFGLLGNAAVALASCSGNPATEGSGQLVDALVTPTYYVGIRSECGLDCHNLTFRLQDRRTRKSKFLKGQKQLAPCPGGEPDCENLIGYMFNDGDDHYFITESGRFTLKRDEKTIVWERGHWQEEGGAGQ